MSYREEGISISCAGDELLGVLASPDAPSDTGVLIVVGGPQYRVGSHRQFVLGARALARAGYATLRFDYRGMGDASGSARTFEEVNEDIGAALDAFADRSPSVERFVLWGLCDAASAVLLYLQATADARIAGAVLLNPWVRSDQSFAQAQIKHYYADRLGNSAFWAKLLRGQLPIIAALRSFGSNFVIALRRAKRTNGIDRGIETFQSRMAAGLAAFKGPILLILSARDMTAKEFGELVKSDRRWGQLIAQRNVSRVELPEADHTFSSAVWREAVQRATVQWLDSNVRRKKAAA